MASIFMAIEKSQIYPNLIIVLSFTKAKYNIKTPLVKGK
jgi:hypothetical protein